jgi:hypothetical protein
MKGFFASSSTWKLARKLQRIERKQLYHSSSNKYKVAMASENPERLPLKVPKDR